MTSPRVMPCDRPHPTNARHERGWSMIELLAVVAVLAILTLAATAGYRSAMLRAHRSEAMATLMALASAQERFHLQYMMYSDDLEAAPPGGLGLSSVSAGGRYAIEITSADSAGFTASATAQGPQAQDTHCATFSVNSAGSRSATNADCWSR